MVVVGEAVVQGEDVVVGGHTGVEGLLGEGGGDWEGFQAEEEVCSVVERDDLLAAVLPDAPKPSLMLDHRLGGAETADLWHSLLGSLTHNRRFQIVPKVFLTGNEYRLRFEGTILRASHRLDRDELDVFVALVGLEDLWWNVGSFP